MDTLDLETMRGLCQLAGYTAAHRLDSRNDYWDLYSPQGDYLWWASYEEVIWDAALRHMAGELK